MKQSQLRDNVHILYKYGVKDVRIRIGSPPLIHSCLYLNFSASKSDLELVTCRIIQKLEGKDDIGLKKYANPDSGKYSRMVESIRIEFNMLSLRYNTLNTLIKAIRLPKEKLCMHCSNASSYC